MSSTQRAAAAMRAVEHGKAAFAAGRPITDNPYKQPSYRDRGMGSVGYAGAWSLYGFWNLGFNDARHASTRETS